MATKKTSNFQLTERLTLPTAGGFTTETIDLGSYIDVADRQALMIEKVDFILQGATPSTATTITAARTVHAQLHDRQRTALQFADNPNTVADAQWTVESAGAAMTHTSNLFPDTYGKTGGRFIVNDQMYLACQGSGNIGGDMNITVRITASVVTLGAKDWMAIAIQSTAADN